MIIDLILSAHLIGLIWVIVALGRERAKRVALEKALIGGFADARKRECDAADRITNAEGLAQQSWNVACGALHRIEGLEAKVKP